MSEAEGVTSGIGILFSSQILGAGVRAGTYVIMLNILGSYEFGIFSIALATALLIQLLTLGGTDWTLNVFYSRGREERFKAVSLVVCVMVIITLVLVFLQIFLNPYFESNFPGGTIAFFWASILFPLIALRSSFSAILNGTRKFGTQSAASLSRSVFLGMVVVLIMLFANLTLIIAFVLLVSSEILGLFIQMTKIGKIVHSEWPDKKSAEVTFGFSKISQSTTGMVTVGREGLVLLLGYILGEADVGIYNITNVLSSPLLYLGDAIVMVLIPFVAKANGIGKLVGGEGIQHILMVVSVSSITVWSLAPIVLPIALDEYAAVLPLLYLMWLAAGIGAISQALRSISYAVEKPLDDLLATTGGTIVAFVLFLTLLGSMGVLAIATAFLIRNILWNIILWTRLSRRSQTAGLESLSRAIVLCILSFAAYILLAFWIGSVFAGVIALLILLVASIQNGILSEEIAFWKRTMNRLLKSSKAEQPPNLE